MYLTSHPIWHVYNIICIYVCVCIHIHIYIHIYICKYIYICTHTHTYVQRLKELPTSVGLNLMSHGSDTAGTERPAPAYTSSLSPHTLGA